MSYVAITAFVAGGFGLLLSLGALLRRPRALAQWAYAVGLTAMAAETVLIGLSLNTTELLSIVQWQQYRLLALAFVPGPWILFSVAYSRGNAARSLARARPLVAAGFVLPILLALAAFPDLLVRIEQRTPEADFFLGFGWSGVVLQVLVLLSAVMILLNLERTFRASVGTMRWRIKFMVLGVSLLFAVRVYLTSQAVMYAGTKLAFQSLLVIGFLLGCALMSVSFFRAGFFHVDVYPSQAVIRHSLTVTIAGIYLVVVGVLGKLSASLGGDEAFPLKALLVLLALVGLTLLLLSDRIQERTRRFVSRNFQRPHYDYRRVWSTFTERTASLVERSALCRAVTQWTSENFNALSVTMWLVDETKSQLRFGASTVLSEKQATLLLADERDVATILRSAAKEARPVDLEASAEHWVAALKRSNPDVFGEKGGNRVCVPLVSKGELLGLMVAGDRVNNMRFSVEDLDLLKCVGDQVAGNLLNLNLSHKLLQAREMEAFQTMSAFFVHDLKNTASTLSLMLQNLPAHFADPSFREDALRGLGKSVTRINELISRLGALRQELSLKLAPVNLNVVVARAIESLGGARAAQLTQQLASTLPEPYADADQLQKVIVNLLVNAFEAVGEGGQVRVSTSQRGNWVLVGVTDNGCGMSAEFMSRSLFRPFQTTKKKGIGIGMFLTKSIVEAHHGKIEVQSESGKGSTFEVLLPIQQGPE